MSLINGSKKLIVALCRAETRLLQLLRQRGAKLLRLNVRVMIRDKIFYRAHYAIGLLAVIFTQKAGGAGFLNITHTFSGSVPSQTLITNIHIRIADSPAQFKDIREIISHDIKHS